MQRALALCSQRCPESSTCVVPHRLVSQTCSSRLALRVRRRAVPRPHRQGDEPRPPHAHAQGEDRKRSRHKATTRGVLLLACAIEGNNCQLACKPGSVWRDRPSATAIHLDADRSQPRAANPAIPWMHSTWSAADRVTLPHRVDPKARKCGIVGHQRYAFHQGLRCQHAVERVPVGSRAGGPQDGRARQISAAA